MRVYRTNGKFKKCHPVNEVTGQRFLYLILALIRISGHNGPYRQRIIIQEGYGSFFIPLFK